MFSGREFIFSQNLSRSIYVYLSQFLKLKLSCFILTIKSGFETLPQIDKWKEFCVTVFKDPFSMTMCNMSLV